LPPAPRLDTAEHYSGLFLFTPSFARHLYPEDQFLKDFFKKLFTRYTNTTITAYVAVIDATPDIRPNELAGKTPYHGVSYRFDASIPSPIVPNYGNAASQQPAHLHFNQLQLLEKSGADIGYTVTIPASNTMFENGQISTVFSSEWRIGSDQVTPISGSTKFAHALQFNLPIPPPGSIVRTTTESLVCPLTFPRRVDAAFGNVIKSLSDPQSDIPSFPASKELTESIEANLPVYNTAGASPEIFAVVIPPAALTRLVLKTNHLLLSSTPHETHSSWLHTIWQTAYNMNPEYQKPRYEIQELLNVGATIHRVVGGGGEKWAKNSGLITLDPGKPQGPSAHSEDIDVTQVDFSPTFILDSIAPPGHYVQFIAALPATLLPSLPHVKDRQSVMGAVYRALKRTVAPRAEVNILGRALEIGTRRNLVEDGNPAGQIQGAGNKANEELVIPSPDPDRLFYSAPRTFGALSTRPIGLKIQTRDRFGRLASHNTTMDIPNTYIQKILIPNDPPEDVMRKSASDLIPKHKASSGRVKNSRIFRNNFLSLKSENRRIERTSVLRLKKCTVADKPEGSYKGTYEVVTQFGPQQTQPDPNLCVTTERSSMNSLRNEPDAEATVPEERDLPTTQQPASDTPKVSAQRFGGLFDAGRQESVVTSTSVSDRTSQISGTTSEASQPDILRTKEEISGKRPLVRQWRSGNLVQPVRRDLASEMEPIIATRAGRGRVRRIEPGILQFNGKLSDPVPKNEARSEGVETPHLRLKPHTIKPSKLIKRIVVKKPKSPVEGGNRSKEAQFGRQHALEKEDRSETQLLPQISTHDNIAFHYHGGPNDTSKLLRIATERFLRQRSINETVPTRMSSDGTLRLSNQASLHPRSTGLGASREYSTFVHSPSFRINQKSKSQDGTTHSRRRPKAMEAGTHRIFHDNQLIRQQPSIGSTVSKHLMPAIQCE
jgi:hypothetical protein